MSEFYIASFSLDEDSLCHYGRPGMKWGQHIFGKENRSNKRLRKETKKSLKRLRALEENVRNKNAIRQPAKENVSRAEAALEENEQSYDGMLALDIHFEKIDKETGRPDGVGPGSADYS